MQQIVSELYLRTITEPRPQIKQWEMGLRENGFVTITAYPISMDLFHCVLEIPPGSAVIIFNAMRWRLAERRGDIHATDRGRADRREER